MRCGCPFFGKYAVYGLLLSGLGIMVAGCGGRGSSTGVSSAGAAAPTAPARPITRTLRVAALVDPTYRKLPQFSARLRGVVADASATLEREFGLALRLEAMEPWTVPEADTNEVIDRLEQVAPGGGADWVLVFSAHPPPRRARMPHVAASRYAGRYVLLTSLGRFVPEGGPRLRRAEAQGLLHAFGRTFGALPACGRGVMTQRIRAAAERGSTTFGPTNRALIEAHLTLPLAVGKGEARITPRIAATAITVLSRPGKDVDCDRPRIESRRRLLSEIVRAAESDTSGEPEGGPAPEPVSPDDGERQIVTAAMAILEQDPDAVWRACRSIAERRPEVGGRCAALAAEALDQPEVAERYLRAWLAHHPADEDAVLRLARIVGRAGDDEAARALLADAVGRNPAFIAARINLGIALARLGDFTGARAAWRAVLDREPEHSEARALLDQLPD